ncbi:MAG: CoA transferase [Chloroflexi bacterium]|nr:CoA transferase [Chloroflexota bacterium]
MAQLPLAGIRIADLTGVWAGTFGMMLLADLGAEVIRVESTQFFQTFTRGIIARPPKAMIATQALLLGGYAGRDPGPRPWNRWSFFNSTGRNKLSMTVDMRRPEGMEVFKRLVKVSDVVVENAQSEVMDRLGVTYEMLQAVKEDIIYMRMPGYGTWGPYARYRVYGANIEDSVGHNSLRGYRDLTPSEGLSGVLVSDAAGIGAAFAVLAALNYRSRTGQGQLVEAAQAENVLPFFSQAIMDYTMNGHVQGPIGNRHPTALQGTYRCRGDPRWEEGFGSWVNLTVSTDAEWAGLVRAMGNPPWARDEKFADPLSRHRHHDELDRLIEEWTLQHDGYALMYMLQKEGVPAAPVLSNKALFDDPHMKDRGWFETVTHPEVGTHPYPGVHAKLSKTPLSIRKPPVRLGEDNEYVYKQVLGFSDAEYREFERLGHIGMDYRADIR